MRLVREILFDISEIEENQNPFMIAGKMIKGLREGAITDKQYIGLSDELKFQCNKHNISTSCENGVELF